MNCHLPEEETKAVGNLQMNLYDMNKQLISQMPILNDEDLKSCRQTIHNYLLAKQSKFYMLLCKDINYYTLLHVVAEGPAAADEVIECVKCLGDVKSVDMNENDAIEIWVQEEVRGPMVMYLFSYDAGVIECAL